LSIEWFLSPWRTSFGLMTQHHALADAKLTLELFQNQLARLAIRYQQEGHAFVHLLPLHFRAVLQNLFSEDCWSLRKAAALEQAAQRFFRPQQAPSPVPTAVQIAIEVLPEDSLLIAPKILWPALAQRFPLVFHSISHSYALILNADRVKATLPEEHPAFPAVLQFIRYQEGANRLPYWGALPMALQLAIGQERASCLCRSSQTYAGASHERHVVALEEIDYYHHGLAMENPSQVLIIARSLALLQNKLLLGEIDYAFLYERLSRESIWMQLAGGQNIIALNREQCNKLAISVPEAAGNCWIEKGRQAKLRVYSAIDLSKQLAQLQSPQIEEVDWENSSPSKAIFLVKPDKKASGYTADQKRVNPESLYRLSYWAYQFQLLRGLRSNAPLVWLIQDSGEVASLLAAARQQGYYIPDERAALARQLELLHQSKGKKLLIVAIDRWAELLDLNYLGPLNYVWDSFKLYEQPQIQTEGLPSDREDEALADGEEQGSAPQKTQDLFSLIEMQKPLIDHFAARVAQEESRMLLLDSRLADYFGLADKWHTGSMLVPLWRNEADYQQQVSELSLFFRAPADPNNLPLDLKDAQEILRFIFLDVSQGQQWYPYQELYLEHILPAEKDLLVSLPTGAGKSLLFQGPALFRSGFTNRLTLVITPLRALMEDQVSALWERGFISNVEYISGDRSSVEMSDIYRRIAGGEITLLYLTPERFRSRAFENALLARMDADAGLEFVVFDEAHCISQWGQEFRPDYLSASRKLAGLIQQPQRSGKMLLFSATVSDQVFEDIKLILA
ncbi:MAG: DEAD/DEAH box helicase, partial [Sphingobacteriales bacterium]